MGRRPSCWCYPCGVTRVGSVPPLPTRSRWLRHRRGRRRAPFTMPAVVVVCGVGWRREVLPRRRAMGETISFKRPDGQSVQGYLAEPAGGSGPGVVVIQEWWGLNAQIKGVADRMAGAGYRALVPDLYRGKVTVEAKEAEHLMTNLNFGDAAGQDVRGAVQHLKAQGGKVGVTGFCLGGALTLLAAGHVPGADAGGVGARLPPPEATHGS